MNARGRLMLAVKILVTVADVTLLFCWWFL